MTSYPISPTTTRHHKFWRESEIATLREMALLGYYAAEIAKHMGRTYYAVTTKASELGIELTRHKYINSITRKAIIAYVSELPLHLPYVTIAEMVTTNLNIPVTSDYICHLAHRGLIRKRIR